LIHLMVAAAWASAQAGSAVPSLDTIAARMTRARSENRAQFRGYTVTRQYTLFGKQPDKKKSQVIAEVVFVPPDSKQFAIQQATGSGLGKMIVRRVLASEAEMAKNYAATDFSPENYAFRFLRRDEFHGQPCYVLELLPRRKDVHLVRGNLWLDARTYLPRRIEGELAKSPSWWVRDLHVEFDYGEIGGMWLPTASEASANLRILGRSTMVSRDVSFKLNDAVRPVSASAGADSHLAQLIHPRQ
jgi:Outer membrane lipoprotein-sorting protein